MDSGSTNWSTEGTGTHWGLKAATVQHCEQLEWKHLALWEHGGNLEQSQTPEGAHLLWLAGMRERGRSNKETWMTCMCTLNIYTNKCCWVVIYQITITFKFNFKYPVFLKFCHLVVKFHIELCKDWSYLFQSFGACWWDSNLHPQELSVSKHSSKLRYQLALRVDPLLHSSFIVEPFNVETALCP